MPAAVLPPPKRVLGDSTKAHRNILPSPKRRKLDLGSSPATKFQTANGIKSAPGSSQPKSQFEEEVLEKLTQDINGLKQNNSEKNQQWERPSLGDFHENKDSLCFQQIDVEEGSIHGGRTAVKLFGVTEVCSCNGTLKVTRRLTLSFQTGHSVLLHVTGFHHYLYIAAPVSFVKSDCKDYRSFLETKMAQNDVAIESVQMVMKENIYGFQGNQQSPYLKIAVTDPRNINKLRTMIEENNANYQGFWNGFESVKTYDSIQYVLRFMIDTGVSLLFSFCRFRHLFS